MIFLLFSSSLLSSCSESSGPSPPQTVVASAGGDVVLPCSIHLTASDDFPTVEWSKQGLQPDVVLLYRDGCETHEMKNPAFRYRTSFIAKELKNGNISLRISNVQLADSGMYRCMSLWKKGRGITEVHLVVGAVSEPKLSVSSAEDSSVTLQCEASCWLPEPRISFLDSRGNDIPADEPRRDEDARGCFTVRRRVTLQDATNRVTCRVHQPETNQTRDSEILLPVQKPCYRTIAISVGAALSLLLACVLAVFLCRRCGKSDGKQKSLVTLSGGSENHSDVTIEMLKSEVDDLKSKLHEKEDSLRQLQNSVAGRQDGQPLIAFSPARIRTPKAGNVIQDEGPKPGGPPVHTSHRRHSSPALFHIPPSASSSSSEKKLGSISCSPSSACSRPGLNAKLQRRHSLVSSGRFTLPDLAEESEMLIA